jgi:hypothetical protein
MLKVNSSKYLDARAKQLSIVRSINVVSTGTLQPPRIYKDRKNPLAGWEEDKSLFPFFWKEKGMTDSTQSEPLDIRWVWEPTTGNMYIGTDSRHAVMTPRGVPGDSVLRGFYFPSKKMVSIRPYYCPSDQWDQWDEGHADLNADVQAIFMMAIKPIIMAQEPGIVFRTNIDNQWLKDETGRFSW